MEGGEAAEPSKTEGHLQDEDPQREDLQEEDPQREDLQEEDPQEQERPGDVSPKTSPPEELASPKAELVQQPSALVFPFDLNQPYDPQAAALKKVVPFFELSSSRQPGRQYTGPSEDERFLKGNRSAEEEHTAEADAPLSEEPQSLHSTLSLALSLSSASGSGMVQYCRPELTGKPSEEGFQRAPRSAVGPQCVPTAPSFPRGILEGLHQEG
jgi:hypothetical protein